MFLRVCVVLASSLDCKTVGFFLKISKEIGKACRKSLTREARERACEAREKKRLSPGLALFSASFQTFCLTARTYLNTQKYGLFCSLHPHRLQNYLQDHL